MLKYSYDLSGNVAAQAVAAALAPQIIGQPVRQIVEPGQTATFSAVIADASGVSFQWKFNGGDIPGATGDSLLLSNVSAANQGQYSVVVTNSAGSTTSAPAELLLDSDRDGLPDSWEIANFGILTSQRGEGDPDHDGVSNIDEFFDGTDPNSPTSLRPRLTVLGDAGGSVAVSPMKLEYNLGETVTLTATPLAPSKFIGWTRDLKSTTNPITLTMNANKTVRATFASPAPLPPGLVAFWRGETDAKDLIGGHDGTFFSGTSVVAPTNTPSGKVGGAFNFDGTVHVRVPDAAALKPAQITIEAWVFPTVQSSTLQTLVARGSSVNDEDTWLLGVINGRPHFQTPAETTLVAPSAIPLNQWTHLAVSFDGTTKRLYVNGRHVASQGGIDALAYDRAAVPVTIGSDWASNASSARFNGQLDEVAIYNRALTDDEIWDVYNADVVGKNVANPYFTSPSRLPDAVPGASYSEPLTTILGTAPISFSLSAGALPPGMALSSAGVLSGVPSAAGTFDFTALATDAANKTTEQLCVLRVLQPVPLSTDLVAWWRGEPEPGGVASDIIGGHNGAFFRGSTAAPSFSGDGKVGSAFAFDGTLYVQVPDAVALRPPEMTAEAWVFPTVQSFADQTVVARGSSTNDDDAWWLGVFNGTPRFRSKHAGLPSVPTSGSGMQLIETFSAMPLNQWTHLAISFDGTTKRLYVDGRQVASQSGLGALVYDPAAVPVTIGSDWASNASSARFNGRVDEVSVYRRALSSDEIFSLADAGAAGKNTAGPYINSSSQLPSVIVGKAFSHIFTSIRGTAPVGFAVSPGSTLPAGLTLTSAGVLSGVLAKNGNFSFVVRATDAAGSFNEQRCSLPVFESVLAPDGLVSWWKAEGNAQDSRGFESWSSAQ